MHLNREFHKFPVRNGFPKRRRFSIVSMQFLWIRYRIDIDSTIQFIRGFYLNFYHRDNNNSHITFHISSTS